MSIDYKNISGHFYDYEKTMQPEKPYIHDYSKTMTMKLLLSMPDSNGESQVFCNFNDALEIIKRVDNLTRGIKKIIYLVGWQFNGHDDRYPAFNVVNEKLKRDCDKNAIDSLKWLMERAFDYNTTVSLHINMTDAYKCSPLWDTYVENNLIAKKDDGEYYDIGVWANNRTAYQVWYKNEWESGYATKRIDELLNMLPIKRAGTIHIDAYLCRQFANSTMNEEREYRRKVVRYFRKYDIDVTSEFLYGCPGRDIGELDENIKYSQRDDLIGLVPMVWWLNQTVKDYVDRPRSLLCGGRYNKDLDENNDDSLGFLVGNGVHGEESFRKFNGKHDIWINDFIKSFCLDGIPFYYQNTYDLKRIDGVLEHRVAVYSDNLKVALKGKKITHNDVVLRDGNDLFMPVLWEDNEIVAYSENGYTNKSWKIPKSFSEFTKLDIFIITSTGLKEYKKDILIDKEIINLSIEPNQALSIMFS